MKYFEVDELLKFEGSVTDWEGKSAVLNTLSFASIEMNMLLLSPWIVEARVKLLRDTSEDDSALDLMPKLF